MLRRYYDPALPPSLLPESACCQRSPPLSAPALGSRLLPACVAGQAVGRLSRLAARQGGMFSRAAGGRRAVRHSPIP